MTSYNEMISDCENLEQLFDLWIKKEPKGNINHQKNTFIADGIVNPDEWEKSKKKILFVLKEAYGKNWNGNTLSSWIRKSHPKIGPWKRIAKVVYGIQNTTHDSITRYKENLSAYEHNIALEQIAVLNIKKSNGDSISNDNELKLYADYDREEIKKEIELIDPDIVICGNTFGILYETVYKNKSLGNAASDNWYYYLDIARDGHKRLFIDYYHPSFFTCPTLLYYYGLLAIYQQALIR